MITFKKSWRDKTHQAIKEQMDILDDPRNVKYLDAHEMSNDQWFDHIIGIIERHERVATCDELYDKIEEINRTIKFGEHPNSYLRKFKAIKEIQKIIESELL